MFYRISRDDLFRIIDEFINEYEVIAPIKKNDSIAFERVNSSREITISYPGRTLLPVKKFFLPPREVLFEYEIGEGGIVIHDSLERVMEEKRVIIGAKPCDISSLAILSRTFRKHFNDPYINARLSNTIIIGITCEEVADTCFCYQAGSGPLPSSNYDLLLTRLPNNQYLVEVGSEKGLGIINNNKELFREAREEDIRYREEKMRELINAMTHQNLPRLSMVYNDLVNSYDSAMWREYAEKCLSCGKCNFVCPTCYCFDVHDETDFELRRGKRVRTWDACHFLSFTRVASGEVFRKDRSSRIKQRIYHKLVYSINDIGIITCVGCGRCIDVCPAGIDIREVILKSWGGSEG